MCPTKVILIEIGWKMANGQLLCCTLEIYHTVYASTKRGLMSKDTHRHHSCAPKQAHWLCVTCTYGNSHSVCLDPLWTWWLVWAIIMLCVYNQIGSVMISCEIEFKSNKIHLLQHHKLNRLLSFTKWLKTIHIMASISLASMASISAPCYPYSCLDATTCTRSSFTLPCWCKSFLHTLAQSYIF